MTSLCFISLSHCLVNHHCFLMTMCLLIMCLREPPLKKIVEHELLGLLCLAREANEQHIGHVYTKRGTTIDSRNQCRQESVVHLLLPQNQSVHPPLRSSLREHSVSLSRSNEKQLRLDLSMTLTSCDFSFTLDFFSESSSFIPFPLCSNSLLSFLIHLCLSFPSSCRAICRTSIIGCDLNRVWTNPSDVMHPEILGVKNQIINIKERYVCRNFFHFEHFDSSCMNFTFFQEQTSSKILVLLLRLTMMLFTFDDGMHKHTHTGR